MNCNTTHYRANSSSVPGDPTAHGTFTNNGSVVDAKETYVYARTGDIKNIGGIIKGSTYVEVKAPQGNVINQATSTTYQDRYGERKHWTEAVISGGEGKDDKNIGTLVYAGKKVINDASLISAVKNNVIYGEDNVESTPQTHRYVSDRSEEESFLGFSRNESETISTDVKKAGIVSSNGRNILMSHEGDVDLTATDLISKEGSDIIGKHPHLLDIVVPDEKHSSGSSFFGLRQYQRDEYHEQSIPTVMANTAPGVNYFKSKEDFSSRGTTFYLPGQTIFDLPGQLDFTSSILNHKIVEKNSGLTLSVFGTQIIGPTQNTSAPFAMQDPTVAQLNQLANSSNAAEVGINSVSTLANSVNTYKDISNALRHNNMVNTLGQRYGLTPSSDANLTVGFTTSKTETTYQTVASGSFYTNKVTFNANKGVNIEGMPLCVTGDMIVNAPKFVLNGVEVKSNYKSSAIGVTASPYADGVDVGISYERSHAQSTHFINQQTYVGGTTTLNAEQWTLNGANFNTGHLAGEVKKVEVITHANTSEQTSESFSANTNGSLSYQHQSGNAVSIDQRSNIQVCEDIDNNFHTNILELTEANIIYNGKNNLNADSVVKHSIQTYDNNQTHGFSISSAEIMRALEPVKPSQHDIDIANLKVILDEKTEQDVNNLISDSELFSKLVYNNDYGMGIAAQNGFNVVGTYEDSSTGSVAIAYANPDKSEMFIAFRGSNNATTWATDNKDILQGDIPRSMKNPKMQKFIDTEIDKYQQKNYSVYMTGHSRGAAQAAVASAEYKVPAVVFDNPGIASQQKLDFTSVANFKSTPNLVNSFPSMLGRQYNYGTTIPLQPSLNDQVIDASFELMKKSGAGNAVNTVALLGQSFFSHSIDRMEDKTVDWMNANKPEAK